MYMLTEKDFLQKLLQLRQQQYYTRNPKLQDYLEKEWIPCKAVSTQNYNYMYAYSAYFIMYLCYSALVSCAQERIPYRG